MWFIFIFTGGRGREEGRGFRVGRIENHFIAKIFIQQFNYLININLENIILCDENSVGCKDL